MRKFIVVLLLVTFTSGCATLGDRRVAAGCQIADGLTTAYALKHGAVEMNPFLAGISPAGIIAIKLAFAFIIWKTLPPKEKATKGDNFIGTSISLLGCLPAANNLAVINGLP